MFAFRVSDTWIAHKEVWIVHVLPVLWQVVPWSGGHSIRCGGCSSGHVGGEYGLGGSRSDRGT